MIEQSPSRLRKGLSEFLPGPFGTIFANWIRVEKECFQKAVEDYTAQRPLMVTGGTPIDVVRVLEKRRLIDHKTQSVRIGNLEAAQSKDPKSDVPDILVEDLPFQVVFTPVCWASNPNSNADKNTANIVYLKAIKDGLGRVQIESEGSVAEIDAQNPKLIHPYNPFRDDYGHFRESGIDIVPADLDFGTEVGINAYRYYAAPDGKFHYSLAVLAILPKRCFLRCFREHGPKAICLEFNGSRISRVE